MTANIVTILDTGNGSVLVELNGREIPDVIIVEEEQPFDEFPEDGAIKRIPRNYKLIHLTFKAAQVNHSGNSFRDPELEMLMPRVNADSIVPAVAEVSLPRFVLIEEPRRSWWQRMKQRWNAACKAFEAWQNSDYPPTDY